MPNKLTWSDAIEKVMLDNNGFAPLKLIYQEISKYRPKTGKTPDNTIQERVQRDKKFIQIEVGVYALTSFLNKLPKTLKHANAEEKNIREHANIQGMLLEIGNKKAEVENTYTNDKKWMFGSEKLGDLATLRDIPYFTYKDIITKSVKFADVIWFNERGFPHTIFEVEHSTDFRDGFIKFAELQDFNAEFNFVAPENRKAKFLIESRKVAFRSLINRVNFFTYSEIENDYAQSLKKTYL